MNNLYKILNTLLPIVPLFVNFLLFILFIYTYELKYILFIILYYINEIINITLKIIFNYILDYNITKRPDNYGTFIENNNLYDIGTSILPQIYTTSKLHKLSTTYGFPSGHSQTMTLFATFTTLYLLHIDDYYIYFNKLPRYILPWIIAFAVIWQRVFSKCHTILQVIIGSFIGIILGYAFFQLYLIFDKKNLF